MYGFDVLIFAMLVLLICCCHQPFGDAIRDRFRHLLLFLGIGDLFKLARIAHETPF